MKLFISDVNLLKEKFLKIGFQDKDVEKIVTTLTENNKIEELEEKKKKDSKSITEGLLDNKFECKFECRAGYEALNIESTIQKYIEKGLKKLIKWLSPVYAFGIIAAAVMLKPQIQDVVSSLYCYLQCNETFGSILSFFHK